MIDQTQLVLRSGLHHECTMHTKTNVPLAALCGVYVKLTGVSETD